MTQKSISVSHVNLLMPTEKKKKKKRIYSVEIERDIIQSYVPIHI
jgi:hypothetical protein